MNMANTKSTRSTRSKSKSDTEPDTQTGARPKGYASETTVSPLQSVGTFPQGNGTAPSAAELAERTRANTEARDKANAEKS